VALHPKYLARYDVLKTEVEVLRAENPRPSRPSVLSHPDNSYVRARGRGEACEVQGRFDHFAPKRAHCAVGSERILPKGNVIHCRRSRVMRARTEIPCCSVSTDSEAVSNARRSAPLSSCLWPRSYAQIVVPHDRPFAAVRRATMKRAGGSAPTVDQVPQAGLAIAAELQQNLPEPPFGFA
jgi:hypothetical protein